MYLYFKKLKFDNSQPQLQIACCYSKIKITSGLLFHNFILTKKKKKKKENFLFKEINGLTALQILWR